MELRVCVRDLLSSMVYIIFPFIVYASGCVSSGVTNIKKNPNEIQHEIRKTKMGKSKHEEKFVVVKSVGKSVHFINRAIEMLDRDGYGFYLTKNCSLHLRLRLLLPFSFRFFSSLFSFCPVVLIRVCVD